jgi:predicted nucleic acid-binding Zn ribbon protein
VPVKSPQTLAHSLQDLLKNLGITKTIQNYDVITRWPEFVGERVAEVSQAVKVERQVLYVKVQTSVWRNELAFMKGKIIAKIDREIGSGVIKDIRFI